jgi:hypothetical protein
MRRSVPTYSISRTYMSFATPRPNQAMQLTASKPADCASRVCRRERMLRGMHRGPRQLIL